MNARLMTAMMPTSLPKPAQNPTGIVLPAARREQSVFDAVVYWTGIGLAIFGNFVLSVVIIPLLLIFSGPPLYMALIIIAAGFGTLFGYLFIIIQGISTQRVIAELFIPVLALINIYIITNLVNILTAQSTISAINNPLLVALFYVIAFSAPYFLLKRARKR